MRYIAFWEFDSDDFDRVLKLSQAWDEEVKKHHEWYPKFVFPSQTYIDGHAKGFYIIEGEHTQLRRMSHFAFPEFKFTFIPIMDVETQMKINFEMIEIRRQYGLPAATESKVDSR
jgi:hypothetical protein